MYRNILVVLVIGLIACTKGEFPEDPTPCNYGDTECLANRINYFLHDKNSGDSSINLLTTDPLNVEKLRIKQGAESPVNIDLKFANNKLYGLKTSKVKKVKGFGKDPNGMHEIHMKQEYLSIVGPYKVTGKVLILPIRGEGNSNFTVIDPSLSFAFKGVGYEKDGETYMKVSEMKVNLVPKSIIYKFENLFNGDKALTDNMNAFLTENSNEVYGEIKDNWMKSIAPVVTNVIKEVFDKTPYAKLFKAN